MGKNRLLDSEQRKTIISNLIAYGKTCNLCFKKYSLYFEFEDTSDYIEITLYDENAACDDDIVYVSIINYYDYLFDRPKFKEELERLNQKVSELLEEEEN